MARAPPELVIVAVHVGDLYPTSLTANYGPWLHFISTLAKPAARSVAEWIHEVWTTNGSGAAPLGSGAWPLATTVEMAEADEMEEEQRYVAL